MPKYHANQTNPQLVMPNFALSPSSFGAGSSATNVARYFVVLEEYTDFTVCYLSLPNFCASLMFPRACSEISSLSTIITDRKYILTTSFMGAVT